ncbi:hypothetical protein RFI_18395 [Reticulomyxa filosa]|uniref:Dynein heavy chain tail domain-containing protein n=1 Tax=Reticulomyxa filosa TaxID=46433 RepID=X6N0K7_RETFI|nr:hypothetical protein RFI_18395 [Reticulomyxa filosa]|eukprot:ETO18852.1 hypothetical protein RFI_18395 [Reticulomyxa filosa]
MYKGSIEANDNLKFLSILQEPCEKVSRSEPKEIIALLPTIINSVRMIWSTSRYYCTADRLTSLLRKVSNQLIVQCTKAIDLAEIYDGDVVKIIQLLHDSEDACKEWKNSYNRVAHAVKKYSNKEWNVDPSSVFAQIDAFMQRCRDLLSICEGQLQFCRKDRALEENPDQIIIIIFLSIIPTNNVFVRKTKQKKNKEKKRHSLPAFGSARGNLIVKSLYEIEDAFVKHIERLKNLQYNILDVNTTAWHEDYTYYKNGVKDLEVMMGNIINSAFEGVSAVTDYVQMLQSFQELCKRDYMKQFIERKTSEVYSIAKQSLLQIKKDFDLFNRNPPMDMNSPLYGGAALWALSLIHRLEKEIQAIEYATLPVTKEKEEMQALQRQVREILYQFIKEKHSEWCQKITEMDIEGLDTRLNKVIQGQLLLSYMHIYVLSFFFLQIKPLLTSELIDDVDKISNDSIEEVAGSRPLLSVIDGHLVCNFDKDLLRVFRESETWGGKISMTQFSIPFAARKMTENATSLQLLRENVMLVVHDFNKIVDELSGCERKLFLEYLKRVEKRLEPGLSKFTWTKKYIKELFVKKARLECSIVDKIVQEYHKNLKKIKKECLNMKRIILIQIDKGQPCVATGFKEKQFRHISYCNIYLKECSESIIEQMKNSYRFFVGQTEDVLRQWQKVIVQVDGDVESALKFAIKSSLQDLSRAINGDGKSDPSPLFKLSMILNLNTGKVDFTPSIVDLIQMIKDVYDQIMQIYKHIPRLGSVLHEDHGGFQVFRTVFDTLCKDSEINSSFVGILEGVSSVTAEMGRLMADWENSYKSIWEADKDIFITRMKDSNQPLEAVDKHITKSECSITKKKKYLFVFTKTCLFLL